MVKYSISFNEILCELSIIKLFFFAEEKLREKKKI